MIRNNELVLKAEPFDVMQYYYSSVQIPVIRCCIYFDGKIDVDKLKRAIHQLTVSYPILKCVFNINKRIWTDGNFSEEDILSIIHQEHKNGTDINSYLYSPIIGIDPSFKVNLIRRAENDFICVTVSHLLCDGRGFERMLYKLSDLYSDGMQETCNTNRSFQQVTKGISTTERMKILVSKSMKEESDEKHVLPFTGTDGKPNLIIRQLSGDDFANIGKYAKDHNASINDILLAAYCKALYDMFKWDTISLPCPVDLRRFSKSSSTCICNLTGDYICTIHLDCKDSLCSILKKVSFQMKKQKNSYHCLKGPMLYHSFYHLIPLHLLMSLFPRIAPVPVLSYTNVGILDLNKLVFYGTDTTDAYISTAMKPVPYFQLTVSTFKEICTLSCCTFAQKNDLSMVNKLMDLIQTNLINL